MDWRSEFHRGLTEFDHVAGRDAAGRTVKEIAIDHGAQLQVGSVSFPRIRFLISKPPSSLMVFSEAMMCVTRAIFRKRHQHPLIGDDAAIEVVDVGDGVDGKAARVRIRGRPASRSAPDWRPRYSSR